MSSPFADYLASVDKTLRGSPFVNDFQTQHEDRGEVWFLRVNVYFIDNSLLHFRELFVGQENRFKRPTPITISAPMGQWFSATTTRRIFPIYPPRRITNTLGKLMSLQQTLPICNLS